MNEIKDTLLFIPVKLSDPFFLKRLLESLKDNGYFKIRAFGVVVIDNGSPTEEIRNLCANYPLIYLRTKGVGKMAALNYGLKKTCSKYVAFTDQDNIIISPNWLKILKSNLTSDEIGYVSGKVVLYKAETQAQIRWEKKGALNKGDKRLELGREFFERFRLKGVPVNLCTVGANHIMPRKVLEEIGLHDQRFGPGAPIDGAGGDLDIPYKLLRKGYIVVYDPRALVGHEHPKSFSSLQRKMFAYGISDTAIHMKFLFEFGDIRSFFQIFYRIGQNFSRFLRSFVGSYPLPPNVAFASILGNLVGLFKYIQIRIMDSLPLEC